MRRMAGASIARPVYCQQRSFCRMYQILTLVLRITLVDAGTSDQDRVHNCKNTLAADPLTLVIDNPGIV